MRIPLIEGKFLVASLLVAIVTGLLFTPGLPGEFVFDDIPNITTNEAVHLNTLDVASLAKVLATPQLSGTTRVLPTLSFAVDYWRAGAPDPLVFKTTNIIIHALTACALAWLLNLLLRAVRVPYEQAGWLAAAAALAWAIHPLQVSAVLYVVQRIQIMGTLFIVLSLLAYLTARQSQIEGRSGRTGLLLTLLLWIVAMGCKEDSILLPAYTLALELTVLRFAAADSRTAGILRRGYLFATLAGTAAYLLIVVPHFWQWQPYSGRDFSTAERLLTEARVLCMYMWQILVPLPQHMPFYYDWLEPSRGLLQPWTTLPAIGVILALLGLAWKFRVTRPLFSFGVLLFFTSHFVASNVIGLELAFEHRNHFALMGAILCLGSMLQSLSQRLHITPKGQAVVCGILLAFLSVATLWRAHTWGSTLTITRLATEVAPTSGRAWTQLCASQFSAGGGAVANNPYLDKAIETCQRGAAAAPQSLNSLTLLVVLKTFRGDIKQDNWVELQERIKTAPMTRDNARIFMILTYHARKGVQMNKEELLKTLSLLAQRGALGSFNLAYISYFIMNDLGEAELALPYFIKAIKAADPDDPFRHTLASEFRAKGRPDLAKKIEQLESEPP